MTANNSSYITYKEALFDAIYLSMKNDDSVFVYGLGVDDPKGHYGTTLNLHQEFGKDRCFDTPLAEDSLTGIGIGAALAGMRPIFVHQRMDFLMLCMNQLVNMASKIHYISNGQQKVPLVVRACIGRSWGQGAQHSQSLYSFFAHIPGIKVLAPVTAYDAKGAMIAAIEDNNPTIIVEHRMLYNQQGFVPNDVYKIDFGKARLLKKGQDITLVAVSYTCIDAVRAAAILQKHDIDAEVIDLLSIAPLDMASIIESLTKTKNLLFIDNDWLPAGISSEVLARLTEEVNHIAFKAKRIGYSFTPCPTVRCLEDKFYPNANSIAKEAYKMLTQKEDWVDEPIINQELEEFKGPF